MPSSNAFLSMPRHAWTNTQADNAFYSSFFPLSSMSSVVQALRSDRQMVRLDSIQRMHARRPVDLQDQKKKNEMIQTSGV